MRTDTGRRTSRESLLPAQRRPEPATPNRHNEKRESYGHALIVDPWGAVVGRLDDPDATGIAVAEIDLGYVASVRARMPIHMHRVPGLLGIKEP